MAKKIFVSLKKFSINFVGLRFKRHHIKNNTILLLETNVCHGEVMSGYIEYFKRLGYNIDCVLHTDFLQDNPFSRHDMSKINCFYLNKICMKRFIKYKNIRKYKHVVIMSSTYYGDFGWEGVIDFAPELKRHPSVYLVEHELNCIEPQNEQEYLDKNHIIVLGKFDRGVFVNPHLFGNVKITKKNKIPTFISVGGIMAFRKNHAELISAIQELVKQKQKFKVVVIGRGKLNDLPDEIKPYIEITGRLNFPEMFEQMEKADFFLPLLDPNNPDHERYITTGVTGSAQLIYGFEKVPVIQKKFAKFYRFNNKNAIVFEKSLATAMSKAISLSGQEYNTLQSNLHKTAQEIQKESFDNLKRIF